MTWPILDRYDWNWIRVEIGRKAWGKSRHRSGIQEKVVKKCLHLCRFTQIESSKIESLLLLYMHSWWSSNVQGPYKKCSMLFLLTFDLRQRFRHGSVRIYLLCYRFSFNTAIICIEPHLTKSMISNSKDLRALGGLFVIEDHLECMNNTKYLIWKCSVWVDWHE